LFEQLIEKLQSNRYITLETTPGHSPTFEPIMDKIEKLGLDKKVDGFSTTDNPLSKLKFNAIIAAYMLQERFNKPTMATVSMRDRNKIALQSDLLGANALNVRALLALTGDSAKISNQPNTKGVFEGDSSLMLDIVKCFNGGIDYAGTPFAEKPKTIYPFSVTNSYAKNYRTLQKKLKKKIEHGTLGIITQPVYDTDNATMLLELLENAKKECSIGSEAQMILGIFPITKFRTAQFLSAHVPGIHVPPIWVEELRVASEISPDEERKVGMQMSKELIDGIMKLHPKVHIMTANQFSVAGELLRDF